MLVAVELFTPTDAPDRLTPEEDGVTVDLTSMSDSVLTETPVSL